MDEERSKSSSPLYDTKVHSYIHYSMQPWKSGDLDFHSSIVKRFRCLHQRGMGLDAVSVSPDAEFYVSYPVCGIEIGL